MHPFKYIKAVDAPSATKSITSNENAKFLAGGTNLIDLMKEDVEQPATLVDINTIRLADIKKIVAGPNMGGDYYRKPGN